MTFRYVLAEGIRAKQRVKWYLDHGFVIVGNMELGGWKAYIMRKDL